MAGLEDFDFNLLKALAALLEEQSVSKAAHKLNLTTPTLSHALKRLRIELDDPLLVRAGRIMVPSPRAELLLPKVRAILGEIREVVEHEDTFDPSTSRREFVIHGSDYIILVVGLTLERIVREAAPTVRLQFMPNVTADPELVRSGAIDLALGVYTDLPPELQIKKLFDEQFVCLVRNDHPRVRQRLSLERFATLPHIQVAPRGKPGGVIDDALAAHGLARTVVRRVPYFLSGLAMVAQTDCVLTVPQRLADTHASVFDLRTLKLPLEVSRYPISQLSHPRRDADRGHRWLRSLVGRACASTKPRRR